MPQETFPDHCQEKVPPECHSVCQVPSQLNSKKGTQLKCRINCQVPRQGPYQLVFQIESIIDLRESQETCQVKSHSDTQFKKQAHLQYLEIQVGIQVEVPVIIQTIILLQCQ